MKKDTISKYLAAALEILQAEGRTDVTSTLKGKAASFGPSVISIGVLPTVVFYGEEKEAKHEHHLVLNAIWEILKKDETLATSTCTSLRDYILTGKDEMALKRDRILKASTAYKLALRTYPEAKKEEKA